jgi:protein-S-isoprenylcysteine O-methyltransferase Ste14
VQTSTVQLLSVVLGAAHIVVWVLGSRWGRPGCTARMRASLPLPSLAVQGGYVALVVPLLYPVLVIVFPGWAYEGGLNWSSGFDVALQALGLGSWTVGMVVLVGAARALGGYLSVDGVTEDHELVTTGPYRYVRHPVYGSFTAVAAGLGLVFRSYLLAGVAAVWLAAALWWAREEEALLSSPEGFADAYRTYSERTGRFLPRLRRVRR